MTRPHDRDHDDPTRADGRLARRWRARRSSPGCRFFAGYPMTPFTEVLEHFASLLPDAGGVCINAESELEAVGMAWGALATGARAATGSTGQGLSLMQESFSEITLAELPLVIFNMARGQQDYYQATRGGGHGDYRHIVLAPQDVARGRRARAARVPPRRQVAQPGARLRRLPARAHAGSARRSSRSTFPELPAEGLGGRRVARRAAARAAVGHAARRRASTASPRSARKARRSTSRTKIPLMEREVRVETGYLDDAETVDRRVRLAGQVREVRDQAAARRRPPHRLRAPDHAVAVPVRDRRRGRGGVERAPRRQLRALGGPDDRRRAHRRRRAARR